MSLSFNATPTINRESSSFGFLDPTTGKWDGMVAEIIEGRAHVANWLRLTQDAANAMLFTRVVSTDGIMFFTALPKTGDQNVIGNLLLSFAKSVVWLMEMATVVVTSVIISTSHKAYAVDKKIANLKYSRFCIMTELLTAALDQPFTRTFNK